ncbi:MAG: tetratricopeptide repeat protein [Flavobacteriales bacterium]
MKKILSASLISIALSSASQTQLYDLWQRANTAYAAGRYAESQALYDSIVHRGYAAPALYYNLGNALFKQNQIGRAIIDYKRALQLDPDNADYKHNLAFAMNAAIDDIQPPPPSFASRLKGWAFGFFEIDTWAYLSLLSAFLALSAFVLYYFSRSSARKRRFFTFFLVFLVVGLWGYGGAHYQAHKKTGLRMAYIVVPNVMVKHAPAAESGDAFVLHDGAAVIPLERVDNWNRIRLADGKTGWVPTRAIAHL